MGTDRFFVLSVVSLVVLGMATAPSGSQNMAADPLLQVHLQPTQETPPILTSNAFGTAVLTFDRRDSMLCYSITYTDGGLAELESGEIAAHFHGPARVGEAAGIQFEISPSVSATGSPKVGCVGPLDATQRRDLFNGFWYINIHSNDFPGGEIRGQIPAAFRP